MNKYNRQKGYYESPVSINIEVTERCNLRCNFCFREYGHNEEMPFGKLCGLLEQISKLGTVGVQFSGGEPLLYPDLCKAVNYAGRLGLHTRISTSGAGMDRDYVKALKEAGLNCCHVSLNGSTEKIHALSRDAYEDSIRAIRLLCQEQVDCVINWVATHDNTYDLPNMVLLANEMDVQRIDILMNKFNNRNNILSPCDRNDFQIIKEQCLKHTDLLNVENCFINLRVFMQARSVPLIDKGCLAGRFHMAVNVRGEYLPCPHCVGSGFVYQTILDYWEHDPILIYFRKIFLEGNRVGGCKPCKFVRYCNPCHIIHNGRMQFTADYQQCAGFSEQNNDKEVILNA